jgi:hypothetical protein
MGSTDPMIPTNINCTDDKPHCGIPGGSGDYEDEGDKSKECNAFPTAMQCQCGTTELDRFDLGTSVVDGYEGKNGDDADTDKEEESSQADDGLTPNVEDCVHSRIDLRTSNVDGYEAKDSYNADKEEDTLQADDGSMQNVED